MSPKSRADDDLLNAALREYQSGNLVASEAHLRQIVAIQPEMPEALHLLGVIAHHTARHEEAIDWMNQAIRLAPSNAKYYCNLGECYRKSGHLNDAISQYRQALHHKPDYSVAHYNLGLALSANGDREAAVECYRQVIRLDPGYIKAITNLGNLLKQSGDLDEALQMHQRVVDLDPNNASGHFNLGNTLIKVENDDEAERAYHRALALRPNWAAALNNLGILLQQQGRLPEAVSCFERSTRHDPNDATSYVNLAGALRDYGKTNESLRALRHAETLAPHDPETLCSLADALQRAEQTDEAYSIWQQALALAPESVRIHDAIGAHVSRHDATKEARLHYQYRCRSEPRNLLAALRAASVCPTVFQGIEAMDAFRRGLDVRLDKFFDTENWTLALDEVPSSGAEPPFNLPFHGQDDLPLKQKYARLIQQFFPSQPRLSQRHGKPQVGFVVTPGHEGIFLKSVIANLNHFDADSLAVTIICPAGSIAAVRAQVAHPQVNFLPAAPRFSRLVDDIRSSAFDLIYYHEVGSDAVNYFLPFFRLAPVQCTTWGIQVTSGIPNLDYYISSRWTEPDDGPEHYSEELIQLDTLLKQPSSVKNSGMKGLADFGLSSTEHIYFCPQHLGKFHPDLDAVLGEILRQDSQAKLVLVEWPNAAIAQRLLQRFNRTISDVVHRVVMLPHQDQASYHDLISCADVLLDPFHFSGVNTTYDALGLSKAIVTLPGRFQRGRFTLGCYRSMDVMDCVVTTPDEYAAKAVRLATDADYRRDVERRIAEANSRRPDPVTIARDMQECLVRLIDASRS